MGKSGAAVKRGLAAGMFHVKPIVRLADVSR